MAKNKTCRQCRHRHPVPYQTLNKHGFPFMAFNYECLAGHTEAMNKNLEASAPLAAGSDYSHLNMGCHEPHESDRVLEEALDAVTKLTDYIKALKEEQRKTTNKPNQ